MLLIIRIIGGVNTDNIPYWTDLGFTLKHLWSFYGRHPELIERIDIKENERKSSLNEALLRNPDSHIIMNNTEYEIWLKQSEELIDGVNKINANIRKDNCEFKR